MSSKNMYTSNEEGCIKYLMKEMDPSEEREFEKMMREDENLLIEVESLRAMYRKLDKLPLQNPPKHLTQEISNKATQIQSERINKNRRIIFIFGKVVAAAAIVLIAITGSFYLYQQNISPAINGSASSNSSVNPWVDRNEVIRYTDRVQASGSGELDSELNKSLNKLKLVESPGLDQNNTSGIHLTGSSN